MATEDVLRLAREAGFPEWWLIPSAPRTGREETKEARDTANSKRRQEGKASSTAPSDEGLSGLDLELVEFC